MKDSTMNKRIYMIVMAICGCFLPSCLFAKDMPIQMWERHFPPSRIVIASIQQTSDGGYILAGSAPMDSASNNYDFWVAKTNDTGLIEWEHTYYKNADHIYYQDMVNSISQTNDDGYILCGGISEEDTGTAIATWIIKIDVHGSIQWDYVDDSTYGGAIRQTDDGGYIIVGDGVKVLKLNNNGNKQWERTYGGSSANFGTNVQQTRDHGYIIAGYTYSNNGDVVGHHGDTTRSDAWIVKLDSTGAMQWNKCYGGTSYDWAIKVLQTPDDGYLFIGNTYSFDGDVVSHHGEFNDTNYYAPTIGNPDGWIVKLNSTGNIEWTKCYGGGTHDELGDINPTLNGEYIVGGFTNSLDGDLTGVSTARLGSGWLFQIDSSGTIQWEQAFNNAFGNSIGVVIPTRDYGYLLRYGDIDLVGNPPPNRNNTIIKLEYPCTSDAVYFGTVELDSCKQDTLCFANTGSAPDTLSGVFFRGKYGNRYSLNAATFKVLNPGEREGIILTFCPTAADTENATAALVIGVGDTVLVPLYGDGTAPLAVNEPLLPQSYNSMIYPNPASNMATIAFTAQQQGTAIITVTNITGIEMLRNTVICDQPGTHEFLVDTRSLAEGSYICTIRQGEKYYTKMFVVVK